MKTPWLMLPVLLYSSAASAQHAGDTFADIGWLHINTLDKSVPLATDLTPSTGLKLLGINTSFTSPGTSASLNNINTVAIATTHFFTDHVAVKLDGGIPTVFHITGAGIVTPTSSNSLVENSGLLPKIDLGEAANNPLAKARQWTPAVIVQYSFRDATARLRPYLGLGAAYTWFTDISVNDHFQAELNQNFGTVLALAAGKYSQGPTHVEATASRAWSAVFNGGFTYALTPRWGIVASMSYLPLHATAHIKILAADGTLLSDSRAGIELNPLVTALLLSYRF